MVRLNNIISSSYSLRVSVTVCRWRHCIVGFCLRVRGACMSPDRRLTMGREARILVITGTRRSGQCLRDDAGEI